MGIPHKKKERNRTLSRKTDLENKKERKKEIRYL